MPVWADPDGLKRYAAVWPFLGRERLVAPMDRGVGAQEGHAAVGRALGVVVGPKRERAPEGRVTGKRYSGQRHYYP